MLSYPYTFRKETPIPEKTALVFRRALVHLYWCRKKKNLLEWNIAANMSCLLKIHRQRNFCKCLMVLAKMKPYIRSKAACTPPHPRDYQSKYWYFLNETLATNPEDYNFAFTLGHLFFILFLLTPSYYFCPVSLEFIFHYILILLPN